MSTVKYTYGWTDPRTPMTPTPIEETVRKVLSGVIAREDRESAIEAVIRRDRFTANNLEIRMVEVANDDNTYRISIYDDEVYVLCFGLSLGANDLEGHYSSVDNLPNWVQERLAVLMLLNEGPPHFPIEGVGRRISRDVFWVFAPETVS